MDNATPIRVKLTFRTKCKLAKLDRATDTTFSSMANLKKLVYKCFPEIEGMVTAPKQHLAVKCKDTAGDYITLEDDDDLDAMELLQNSNVEFAIDVLSASLHAGAHPAWRDGRPAGMTLDHTPVRNYRTIPCRRFQSGFCKHGERCTFLHDLADRPNPSPDNPNLPTESLAFASKLKQCRSLLEAGFCRYGEKCRYSHDLAGDKRLQSPKVPFHQPSTTRFTSRQDGTDYNWWLNRQAGLDSAATIPNLGGEQGLQMLFKIVKERELPHDTTTRFVKLLAREEIRTNLTKLI